mgnify:CR=1 FL=1
MIIIATILILLLFIYRFIGSNKGCLHGKTAEEKDKFFTSLSNFCSNDNDFFVEQYWDLLPHERDEYNTWVKDVKEQKKLIIEMLDIMIKINKTNH